MTTASRRSSSLVSIAIAVLLVLTGATGAWAAGKINGANIKKNSIPGNRIKKRAVGTTRLAASAVTSAKIATGAVTGVKLTSGSVTAAKIGGGAVTSAKLANGAVSNAKLADGSVTDDELATDSVTTAKIADGAVTSDKLATNPKVILEATGENIPDATTTALSFPTELLDDSGMHVLSGSAATAPTDGLYRADALVLWGNDGDPTGYRQATIRVTGSSSEWWDVVTAADLGFSSGVNHPVLIKRLTAGQSLSLYLYFDETDNSTLVAAAQMTVERIAD